MFDDHSRPRVSLAPRNDYQEFEYEAALAYARALNTLNPDNIAHLLADDCVYESQNVRTALVGKEAILDYWQDKFETLRAVQFSQKVYAELGKMAEIYVDRPCVIIAQGFLDDLVGVVLFEVNRGKIKRIDFCSALPNPSQAIRSGEYPS